MNLLLRITGLGKLISAYKYVQFNGPGVVRFSGVGLILLVGVIHVLLLPWHYEAAPYLGVSFGVLFAGSLYRELRQEIEDATPPAERLGISRPTMPLED